MKLINAFLKARMLACVVFHEGGNRRNLLTPPFDLGQGGTTLPHAYTRVRTWAVAVTVASY